MIRHLKVGTKYWKTLQRQASGIVSVWDKGPLLPVCDYRNLLLCSLENLRGSFNIYFFGADGQTEDGRIQL